MTDATARTSARNTVARNTAFNAAGRLWEAVVALLLTPYAISHVGLGAWGLWSLVSVFSGYIALFEFGLSSGFSKFIAQYAAHNDHKHISAVVSTGFFTYLPFALILTAIGWPCIDWLFEGITQFLARLHPDQAAQFQQTALTGDVKFLLRAALILFAGSNCVTAFTAVQTGLQRMGITNALSAGAALLKAVFTVVFLEMGFGLRGLMYVNILVFIFFGLASAVIAYRLVPELHVRPSFMDKDLFKRLLGFGWRSQIAKFSNLIMFNTDRLVIAALYSNMALVGLYRIGEEMAGKMRQLGALLMSALLPAASHLDAREEHRQLQALYTRSTKYVASVVIPLGIFMAAAAGPVMRTWMADTSNPTAENVLRILALGYIINLLPGAGVSIALGKGRPDMQMKAGLISTVSNILLTVGLVFGVGFYGIALATSLSMLISTSWFMYCMRNVIAVRPARVLKQAVLWPCVAGLPGATVCFLIDYLARDIPGRRLNALALLVCTTLFGVCYTVLIRRTPFLDRFDADFMENTLRLGRVPGFKWWIRRIGDV